MEGNERITLYRPNDSDADSYGQITTDFQKVEAYALRQDRGGRETTYSDQNAGKWQTRFKIRRFPKNEDLDEKWFLVDGRGILYDIESRTEFMGRRTHWLIYAIRR